MGWNLSKELVVGFFVEWGTIKLEKLALKFSDGLIVTPYKVIIVKLFALAVGLKLSTHSVVHGALRSCWKKYALNLQFLAVHHTDRPNYRNRKSKPPYIAHMVGAKMPEIWNKMKGVWKNETRVWGLCIRNVSEFGGEGLCGLTLCPQCLLLTGIGCSWVDGWKKKELCCKTEPSHPESFLV